MCLKIIKKINMRGRRNIWRCWKVTSVAPRIVLDVTCVTRSNHESHFSRQVQYLVQLKCLFWGGTLFDEVALIFRGRGNIW